MPPHARDALDALPREGCAHDLPAAPPVSSSRLRQAALPIGGHLQDQQDSTASEAHDAWVHAPAVNAGGGGGSGGGSSSSSSRLPPQQNACRQWQ